MANLLMSRGGENDSLLEVLVAFSSESLSMLLQHLQVDIPVILSAYCVMLMSPSHCGFLFPKAWVIDQAC